MSFKLVESNYVNLCINGTESLPSIEKEQKIEEMNLVLSTIAECLRCLAIAIKPFIPYLANQILDILAISAQNRNFLNIDNQYCLKENQQIIKV